MAFSILHAQSPSGRNLANRKFHYQGTVHIGMLNGSSSAATNLQTVHGVTYRGWFTGIGIGLDNYSYRTAPLFVELRKTCSTSLLRRFYLPTSAGKFHG